MGKAKSPFNIEKGVLKILRSDGGAEILSVCSCTLFFQKVCFLLPICLPCVVYGSYITKINAVL